MHNFGISTKFKFIEDYKAVHKGDDKVKNVKDTAVSAQRTGDMQTFKQQYGEAKNILKSNNAEIKRLEALQAAGFATPIDNDRIENLKNQNKTLNAVMSLVNKNSDIAAGQTGGATPTEQPTGTTPTAPPTSTTPADTNEATTSIRENSPSADFALANQGIQSNNDEARWAYMGTASNKEFAELEALSDKLNAALKNGASPAEIQAIAKDLNKKIDSLQANLTTENAGGTKNNASIAYLGKMEESVSQLIKSADQVINSPASKLSEAINQIPEADRNTPEYKELTALNKQLNDAKMQGKDPKVIADIAKNINRLVDNWQAKDGNSDALNAALANIETKATDVIRSGNGEPVPENKAINIDRENNIINIDTNKDGKVDYQIKMEGKSQAWEVTKLGADGKPENSFRVWGDPHVDLDSDKSNGNATDINFLEDATFVLEGVDGSPNVKISVDTKMKEGNDKVSYSSNLTITNGDAAVKVSGIDDNKVVIGDVLGDGQKIDEETNDGTVFVVNDTLDSMDVVSENGRASVSSSSVPMFATSLVDYEYNEENAFKAEEETADS